MRHLPSPLKHPRIFAACRCQSCANTRGFLMKTFRLLLAGFLFLCTAALVLAVLSEESRTPEENTRLIGIVDRYCAPQWHALTTSEKAAWLDETPASHANNLVEVPADDPSAESFEVWNKHIASTVALEDHIRSFFTLYKSLPEDGAGTEDEFPDAFASYRAKYDLWSCLSLNSTERQLLEAKFHSIDKTGDATELYQAEDQYHCAGLERIREAVFNLDPSDKNFTDDFREIAHEHLRVC
ncbi:hypothetical protein K3555_08635 [Leisingera sp. M527]|uniref:hypothetical protein n=1 Tax=Leisingera sp. M527 TaxID=2867014 RepID=UPI0021A34F73|nr:hypothetical protein [Leisingera sp. M527]UWQ34531.1 hypothetical protein K3555_08635 [Leisingera sp. M527]